MGDEQQGPQVRGGGRVREVEGVVHGGMPGYLLDRGTGNRRSSLSRGAGSWNPWSAVFPFVRPPRKRHPAGASATLGPPEVRWRLVKTR